MIWLLFHAGRPPAVPDMQSRQLHGARVSVPYFFVVRCACYAATDQAICIQKPVAILCSNKEASMRIAKPLLLVTTPVGVLGGFYECYTLAGGLLILMISMVGVIVAAFGTVIATIRREERESKARTL
jgi:hypothetical protein